MDGILFLFTMTKVRNASMVFFPPIETRATSSNHDHPGPPPKNLPLCASNMPGGAA